MSAGRGSARGTGLAMRTVGEAGTGATTWAALPLLPLPLPLPPPPALRLPWPPCARCSDTDSTSRCRARGALGLTAALCGLPDATSAVSCRTLNPSRGLRLGETPPSPPLPLPPALPTVPAPSLCFLTRRGTTRLSPPSFTPECGTASVAGSPAGSVTARVSLSAAIAHAARGTPPHGACQCVLPRRQCKLGRSLHNEGSVRARSLQVRCSHTQPYTLLNSR